jgi:hypothetical protein
MKYTCQICGDDNCQVILKTKNERLARYGFSKCEDNSQLETGLDLNIAYCNKCSYAWNTVFQNDKIKYDSDQIIEAGHFSKRYLEYQKVSALHLRKLLGFKPDTVVEIGAGAGIFINEFDAKRKIAIEPSHEANQIDSSVEVFNEYFTEEKFNLNADIVVMRQVLEHIKDPIDFLKKICNSFNKKEEFYLYIEVPNSTLTFKFGRFYDYYYEHCNYFSINSLIQLATQLDMCLVDLSTAMDGELVSVLLTKNKIDHQTIKVNLDINRDVIVNKINKKILEGKKILAWGASGNGVQILNNLKITKDLIAYTIDSDKNKQGKFIPGTNQKIISPEEAEKQKPDVVLVLTQFHKAEIGESCKKLFRDTEVWFVN